MDRIDHVSFTKELRSSATSIGSGWCRVLRKRSLSLSDLQLNIETDKPELWAVYANR